jgi:hypothetical protein
LLIDSKNLSIIHNDISHSIENTDNYIQTFKRLNTILKQASVTKISLETKEIEQFYVFENNQIKISSNLLIPEAFLQSIQINDEKTTQSLLSEKLNKTSINKLKNYFGNINQIYLNRHNNNFKANYTILGSSGYKNYNFEIVNNKINDIEEIF